MKTPYFYIIEHKETGVKYAGSKWAKNANPNNFMTERGHQTSSNTIKKLIKSEGLQSFEVIEIIKLEELNIPFGCQTIDEYESWFLETNDCAKSKDWYNMVPPWSAAFGTEEFYKNMVNKHGVKYPGQMQTHVEKNKATCNAKYGVDNYFSTEESKNKLLDYIHAFDEDATNLFQLEVVKEKSKATCLSNHGVEHPAQSDILFRKMQDSLFENHGVKSPMQSIKLKEAHRNSCKSSLGVESPMQSEKVVAKYRTNYFNKYGVDYPSKVKFYCEECDRTSTGISNITRHHKSHKGVSLLLPNGAVSYTKHLSET